MNYLIYLTLFFNFLFPIGLRALIIPQSAELVASTSTGLANYPELNPANLIDFDSFYSLSVNNWLADVDGQKTSMLFDAENFFKKTYIALESLKTDNIEFRNVKKVKIRINIKIKFKLLYDKNNSLAKKIKLEQMRKQTS